MKKGLIYKKELIEKGGISLIVLVITIIVIIVLATTVIISLSKNNPIESANEAVFRSDISEIKSNLDIYVVDKYTDSLGIFDESTINGKVSDFLAGITKYDDELKVVNGRLVYYGDDIKKVNIAMDMNIIVESDIVAINGLKFNKPNMDYLPDTTTKAIKWNENNVESQISLAAAKTDISWYDYSSKKWANVLTSNNGNNAYWVWIPRFAYKINNSHQINPEQIEIKFLGGKTNVPADGSNLPDGYIVHPAFTFDGKELTGIWVAKYEASSSMPNTTDANGFTGGGNTSSLQVRVLPDQYSWRNISSENIQKVSIDMTSLQGSVGTNVNLDTHQMKNTEWGAVAYLSQSIYGEEPWINPYGDWISGSYKLKTGYSGESKDSGVLSYPNSQLHTYNDIIYGGKSSTTGNIYGIYDMSGGAYEKVAAILDNGNSNISLYGGIYTRSNKIKDEYSKYYDIYEPGDDEKEGKSYYGSAGTALWNLDGTSENNLIRKNLTIATYNNFIDRKGDALWEVSNESSYRGKFTDTGNIHWLLDTTRTQNEGWQPSRGWNLDYILIGYALEAWFDRGGYFGDSSGAGLFCISTSYGCSYVGTSFRPVLIAE